ncbi:acyl-CoA carboxylase subunit epsilon [Nonomuraea sp. MCN248]|uniref:Acyl-CoA carboxylase subunit epsilon n=1 Tax=Nonomuraea corallina TaxID=2989783 RepID=A0ABT4SDL7_9ACTN|nr:acyl-CoA carboxylase subunit epsilon [Nonomuraea corallina]MDA0635296.1 acyl-CoA carboxylase subunit epsilon [Nonomuraea corallina]
MTEPSRPHLRIVRGDATPEEIAALVAVLAARPAAPEAPSRIRTQSWRNPVRNMRKPLTSGKSAWRMSALP